MERAAGELRQAAGGRKGCRTKVCVLSSIWEAIGSYTTVTSDGLFGLGKVSKAGAGLGQRAGKVRLGK